ncbi:DUF427 domain-containing protein [Actinacidiphila rubida]|uniref:Uncharacterized conserved protein, DUF427 family n=1 Tax=Actinacidiphila rubida TaxID=310780 RepID=A0A1H8J0K7_9ACTN|nr:DUF427 domain-containing protein [Actinacidiphila rubida]SEN73915.1 Uncharacterized conserved protein, DUF427 family [Actinacidiphila rubida]
MSDAAESVWDYPRPPVALACHDRVVVEHSGDVVADTTRAVRVLETSHPPVFYVPRQDIHVELTPSRHTSWCEWKGRATYWHVHGAGWWLEDAAWSYADPSPGFETLTDHVAFYPSKVDRCTVDGELVVPQPGDFYGGWITSRVTGPFKGAPGTAGW